MNLSFKPTEYKLEVETITLPNEDMVKIVELFVNERLSINGQEVFYSHIDETLKATPNLDEQSVLKEALFQAVVGEMAVKFLRQFLEENKNNLKFPKDIAPE